MSKGIELWSGEFGDDYHVRNAVDREEIERRYGMWRRIWYDLTPKPRSILEVGAGNGANLIALSHLTDSEMWAVEPNASARKELEGLGVARRVLDGSAQAIPAADSSIALVFTYGVLIHISRDELGKALDEIHRVTRPGGWIAPVEYFSVREEEIPYRGHKDALWKRDYGSLFLDRFDDLSPEGCGFEWNRLTGLDNVTWTILRKRM